MFTPIQAQELSGFLVMGFIGMLLIALIAGTLAAFLYNRDAKIALENSVLRARIITREEVFREVSEELHDNVGQLLSTAKALLGLTERNMDLPPQTLVTAQETIGQAIKELRFLTRSFNLEWLKQFDLLENLEREIERINESGTLKIKLRYLENDIPIDKNGQLFIFRLIQEGIQNVLKHSIATQLKVDFSRQQSHLIITVTDNGEPYKTETKAGMGMLIMERRAKFMGGSIVRKSNPDGNTLLMKLPFTRQ